MSTADPTVASAAETILDNPNGAATEGQSTKDANAPQQGGETKILGKFNDQVSLEKAYKELESRLGSSVHIPADDASAEDQAKFFNKIGRPASKDGYEFAPSDLPGGSDEDVKLFRGVVHDLGLTKRQAEAFWKWSNETGKARIAAYTHDVAQARDKQADALRAEWGNDYEGKAHLAAKVANRFGGDEFRAIMRTSRLGDNPIVLKTLAAIGAVITEDVLEGGTAVAAQQPSDGRFRLVYDKSPELK